MYLAFGEIMARITPAGGLRLRQALPGKVDLLFAGAEANVCVSLSLLGERVRFLTALPPRDAVVDAALGLLSGFGVDTSGVVHREGRLGVYYFERGANQRSPEVIYDRTGSAIALAGPEEYDFSRALEGVSWVHVSGITPALSEAACRSTRELVRRARDKGATVSCDLNFRSKLWRWRAGTAPRDLARECMREIVAGVDLLIGSPAGVEDVLGIAAGGAAVRDGRADAAAVEKVARDIMREFGNVSKVALTLRENISASHNLWGGMFLDAGKGPLSSAGAFFAPEGDPAGFYDIRTIVDPLGAGDAFAAGLIHALNSRDYATPRDAIRFATAAGCLKHSIPGDFNVVSRGEIEGLMAGRSGGQVKR